MSYEFVVFGKNTDCVNGDIGEHCELVNLNL